MWDCGLVPSSFSFIRAPIFTKSTRILHLGSQYGEHLGKPLQIGDRVGASSVFAGLIAALFGKSDFSNIRSDYRCEDWRELPIRADVCR